MTDQNTRPQPSTEPVAYLYELKGCAAVSRTRLGCEPGETETPLYPASALEAARREALDWATEQHKKADEYADRIAALEADNARLMGLVEDATDGLELIAARYPEYSAMTARATLAKLKETPDAE